MDQLQSAEEEFKPFFLSSVVSSSTDSAWDDVDSDEGTAVGLMVEDEEEDEEEDDWASVISAHWAMNSRCSLRGKERRASTGGGFTRLMASGEILALPTSSGVMGCVCEQRHSQI